jgi:hypothetical protein
MLDRLQFAVIVFIIVIDDLAHEVKVTGQAMLDAYRYRIKWVVLEKLKLMFSRKR